MTTESATGVGLRARIGLLRSMWLYLRPGRQRSLRRFYAPFVSDGDLVFDLGAHLGDRTRAFAALGARVVALEPNPDLAGRLRAAFDGDAGVEVVEAAVDRRPGRATLRVSSATPTVSSLNARFTEEIGRRNPGFAGVDWDREETVEATTLDAMIERYGEPAFCKIDIEGHEPEALAGLSRPLGALSFEFVSGALDAAAGCIQRLAELGEYRYNAVAGERRRFLWPERRSADSAAAWLAGGADGLASGDLYAWRVDAG